MATNNIIDAKFDEWTKGLNDVDARISVFEKIRDIPYAIIPEFYPLEEGPAGMLESNAGFCVPKHYLLGMLFAKLGIRVRYCAFAFFWGKQGITCPPAVSETVEGLPETFHLASEAYIDHTWVLVDATWDKGLKKAGFPVNEEWDGRGNTKNGVKSLWKFMNEDALVIEKTLKEKLSTYTLPEKLQLSRFSVELNKWLEEIRANS